MPDYSIRIYQLNYYIKQFLPDLFYHFKKHQINPDIFFSKWILTIFSSYLSFEILAKIWDIFLIDKWKAIFKFCIVFLSEIYDVIITMDLNTLSKYFRENSKRLHTNINKLLDKYSKFKITNRELQELRENFFIDQIKKKLEVISTYIYYLRTKTIDGIQISQRLLVFLNLIWRLMIKK